MNRTMLDILACPMDKHYPLELSELSTKNDIIIDGILTCPKCSRFFPIIEEIPIMLPDDLRDKNQEIDFLKKYQDKLSDNIKKKSKPWGIN